MTHDEEQLNTEAYHPIASDPARSGSFFYGELAAGDDAHLSGRPLHRPGSRGPLDAGLHAGTCDLWSVAVVPGVARVAGRREDDLIRGTEIPRIPSSPGY